MLSKCSIKFDGMRRCFIRNLKPSLNVQMESIYLKNLGAFVTMLLSRDCKLSKSNLRINLFSSLLIKSIKDVSLLFTF